MFLSLLLFSSLLISMNIWARLPHGFKLFLRCIYSYIMCTGFCLYVCEPHSANEGQRRALMTPSSYRLLEGLPPFAGDPCQVTQSWPKSIVGLCSFSFPFILVYSKVNWNLSNHTCRSTSLPPVTVLQVKPIGSAGSSHPTVRMLTQLCCLTNCGSLLWGFLSEWPVLMVKSTQSGIT